MYLPRVCYGVGQLQCATLPQNTFPQLNSNDAKDEENEEAEKENVP